MTCAPIPSAGPGVAETSPAWVCHQAGELQLRQWEADAAVVYDHSTGHTHLVDALAAHLLRRLQQTASVSEATLARSLRTHLLDQPAAKPAALVAQGLATLHALGLARPVPAGRP